MNIARVKTAIETLEDAISQMPAEVPASVFLHCENKWSATYLLDHTKELVGLNWLLEADEGLREYLDYFAQMPHSWPVKGRLAAWYDVSQDDITQLFDGECYANWYDGQLAILRVCVARWYYLFQRDEHVPHEQGQVSAGGDKATSAKMRKTRGSKFKVWALLDDAGDIYETFNSRKEAETYNSDMGMAVVKIQWRVIKCAP